MGETIKKNWQHQVLGCLLLWHEREDFNKELTRCENNKNRSRVEVKNEGENLENVGEDLTWQWLFLERGKQNATKSSLCIWWKRNNYDNWSEQWGIFTWANQTFVVMIWFRSSWKKTKTLLYTTWQKNIFLVLARQFGRLIFAMIKIIACCSYDFYSFFRTKINPFLKILI